MTTRFLGPTITRAEAKRRLGLDTAGEPSPPLEATIQAQGKRLLELAGYHVTDFSQGRKTRQTEGIPDQYCRHPELANFWIEWKRPESAPLSPHQTAWHRTQRECGGEPVHVVWSLEGLASILRGYGAAVS